MQYYITTYVISYIVILVICLRATGSIDALTVGEYSCPCRWVEMGVYMLLLFGFQLVWG